MTKLTALAAAVVFVSPVAAQYQEISFPAIDGGTVSADRYGDGAHAVVLAHGAVFNKESWRPQGLRLAEAGLRVLAIDFRGYGKSEAGGSPADLHLDVLSAVRFLHQQEGVERVSVVGGSMGARASARASMEAEPGEIDRLVLLAPPSIVSPERIQGNKLFIVSEGDGLAASVRGAHAAAKEPKKLTVLPGSAHAQHIFKTRQAEALYTAILDWLTAG